MHSSKKLKAIAFTLLVLLITIALNYLLVPWSQIEIRYGDYLLQKENIDCLFLGDSLILNAIYPSAIKEKTGEHSYVFTMQGANPKILYLLAQDALSRHKIKTLVVGIDILQSYRTPPYIYPHSEELYRQILFHSHSVNPTLFRDAIKGALSLRYTYLAHFATYPENVLNVKDVLQSRKWKRDLGLRAATVEDLDLEEPEEKAPPIDLNEVLKYGYEDKMDYEDKIYLWRIKNLCSEKNTRLVVLLHALPKDLFSYIPSLNDCYADATQILRAWNIDVVDERDSGDNDEFLFHDYEDKIYLWRIKNLCNDNNTRLVVLLHALPKDLFSYIPSLNECYADATQILRAWNIDVVDERDSRDNDEFLFHDYWGHYNLWYKKAHTDHLTPLLFP